MENQIWLLILSGLSAINIGIGTKNLNMGVGVFCAFGALNVIFKMYL